MADGTGRPACGSGAATQPKCFAARSVAAWLERGTTGACVDRAEVLSSDLWAMIPRLVEVEVFPHDQPHFSVHGTGVCGLILREREATEIE